MPQLAVLSERSACTAGAVGNNEEIDLIKARTAPLVAEEDTKQKSRSRKARARRLSYVDTTEEGEAGSETASQEVNPSSH